MDLTQIPTVCFKRKFLRTVHKHVSGNLSELCNNFQSLIKLKNKQKKFATSFPTLLFAHLLTSESY